MGANKKYSKIVFSILNNRQSLNEHYVSSTSSEFTCINLLNPDNNLWHRYSCDYLLTNEKTDTKQLFSEFHTDDEFKSQDSKL